MGDKFKLVLKIEEVMTTKFFDGKSMEEIGKKLVRVLIF